MPEPPRDAVEAESLSDGGSTSLTLLAKLRNQQQDAWERLDRLYGPLVHFWCLRSGLDLASAEDVRQQVYLTVFSKIGDFRREHSSDSFKSWLSAITSVLIQAHYRKLGEQTRGEGGTDACRRLAEVPAPAPMEDEPEEVYAGLLHRALELIQDQFSPRDWEIFQLLVMEGQTAPEVARKLNLKSDAVRQVKTRILKRVQEELGDIDAEPPASLQQVD